MKKIMFVLFLLPIIMNAQNCPSGSERVLSPNSTFEKEVLRLTNIERKKRGLNELVWNESLAYSARYHAKDMAENNYFDHDSYERKNGRLKKTCETFDRIEAFISLGFMAENIAAGNPGPEEVVQSWMKSNGHRKNILNEKMTELGVGYYYSEDSDYGHYWVQNFGGE